MGLAQTVALISEADYLKTERLAPHKREYYDGEVFAMAGGSRQHSLIAANVIGELRNRLARGRGCVVYDSNLRVKVEATGLYTYPDVTVACGRHRFTDAAQDTLLNPTVLVEVLSDSTEAYDRGKKFEHYRQIPSLRAYLLVSQREPRVEMFARQPDGQWLWREAVGMSARLEVPALKLALPLAEVFAQVKFDAEPRRRPAPVRPQKAARS